MDELLWYVGYGSNMSAQRLSFYLRGGRPPGGMRDYPGSRDPNPPARNRPLTLPGRIHFAGRSRTWGGGMAFYDHRTPGPAPARAYLLTIGQFADLADQESDLPPVPGGPIEAALRDPALLTADGEVHSTAGRLYSDVVRVGTVDGRRALTLTGAHRLGEVPRTAPSAAYRAVIARGLREAHGLSDDQIADYFRSVTG